MTDPREVRALGWTSLGFGIFMQLFPTLASWAFGMGRRPILMRVLGIRDLIIGTGLLTAGQAQPWVRARARADAGDAALMTAGLLLGRFAPIRSALGVFTALSFSAYCHRLARMLEQAER